MSERILARKDADIILSEYRKVGTPIDSGNLFFAALTYKNSFKDLQAKLDLAVEALRYYAMDMLVDPCLSDIIFDSIEHECTTCRTKTTGVTSCNDDKIGAVAREALQKIKDINNQTGQE